MRWLVALLMLIPGAIHAATINAASVSYADVSAAEASASDGDTIVLPSGTNTWTTELATLKSVVFQGQTNTTRIIDGLTSAQSLFDFTRKSGHAGVLGIWFEPGARTTKYANGTVFTRDGASDSTFELAGCVFNGVKSTSFRGGGWSSTRIHDCYFTNVSNTIWFWNEEWSGGVLGHGSWTNQIAWGGTNCTVIEDCVFDNASMDSITDTYAGARLVFRRNLVNNGNPATHGTGDGSGNKRGPSHQEWYQNTFTANPATSKNAIHIRGGAGVCWSNTYSGFSKFLTLHYYRFYADHGKFGIPDGRHEWDLMAFDDGAGTPGGAGDGIYAAGTASAGSTDQTLVVSGAGWTTDQWVGYIVRVTNSAAYTRTNDGVRFPPVADATWQNYFCSTIQANTSDTITVREGIQSPTFKPFREGETFEIVKCLLPLDGIGAALADDMTSKAQFPTIQNLNQKRFPWRIWGNINRDSGTMAETTAEAGVWEDYNWFEQKSGFDGSTGMGVGNTAAMEAITPTSTNGISFWNNETYKLMVWSNSTWTVDVDYSAYFAGGGEPPEPPPPSGDNPKRGRANRGNVKRILIE